MGRQVWLLTSARQLVRFIVSNMFLLSETLLVLLLANEVSPMKVGPWRSINKHPHPLCHLSPSSQEREGDERLLEATVYPLSSILLLLISWTPDFLYKHWGHLPPPWTLPHFASFPLSASLMWHLSPPLPSYLGTDNIGHFVDLLSVVSDENCKGRLRFWSLNEDEIFSCVSFDKRLESLLFSRGKSGGRSCLFFCYHFFTSFYLDASFDCEHKIERHIFFRTLLTLSSVIYANSEFCHIHQ